MLERMEERMFNLEERYSKVLRQNQALLDEIEFLKNSLRTIETSHNELIDCHNALDSQVQGVHQSLERRRGVVRR